MKNHKVALIRSGLAFLLCLILFAGVSFAWFTLVMTNSDNKIQSGRLELDVEYFGIEPEGGGAYKLSAPLPKEREVFSEVLQPDKDAPGLARYVRVENTGNLEALVILHIRIKDAALAADDANLAEVLKFRMEKVDSPPDDGGDIPDPVDYTIDALTLSTLIYNMEPSAVTKAGDVTTVEFELGKFDPAEAAWYRFDYVMCPWAGNTYMDMRLDVDILVGAIQYRATLDNLVFVSQNDDLQDVIDTALEGSTIVFVESYAWDGDLLIGTHHNFDLNGNTLTVVGDIQATVDVGCSMDIANGVIVADSLDLSGVGNIAVNLVDLDLTDASLIEGDTIVHK